MFVVISDTGRYVFNFEYMARLVLAQFRANGMSAVLLDGLS